MTDKKRTQKEAGSVVKTFPVPFALGEIKGDISINTNNPSKASKPSKEKIINLALKLHSQGKILEAEKYYRYCINKEFKDPRVFSNYGIILKNNGKRKEAEKFYRKAIELKPNFAEAHNNLGNILKELGKSGEAKNCYLKAIELNPNFAKAYLNIGNIMKDNGELKEAEKYYQKAIEVKPNFAESHSNLGSILKDLGNLEKAELSIRRAIKLNPNFAEAYSNLGTIMIDLGQLQEAKTYYLKAIELKPDFAQAYSNLGNTLKDLGQLQDAKTSYSKAIELNPDFAQTYSNLGTILIDLGQLQEAEIFTRKALELEPNFIEAQSNLGIILKDLGKLKEAEIFTRKALKVNPDLPNAHLNLGTILKDLGQLASAKLSILKAIELKPDLAEAHAKLGELLFELGKREEASIAEWNAIKINTSSSFLKSYLENSKLINKTAFWVHSCSIFNQFQPVIEINPKSFEILVPNKFDKKIIQKIHNSLKNKDIRIRSVNELIEKNLIYKKLVSNRGDDKYESVKYNIKTSMNLPIIKLLGKKNIRFMYTAGKDQYTINSYWNKYYDGILCYGPYHEEKFKVKHKIATSQMGYPRFDKYFNPGFKRDYLLEKFKCDPTKKTIVWLPTWTSLSSINKYHKVISSLKSNHNIVVRPHPSMKTTDPINYKKLFNVDFNYIDDNEDDNVQLYALSDLMLFDYGGPMFGALYLNKNFAFLEMTLEAKDHPYLGKKSSEDYLKSFFPDRKANLKNLKSICDYCLNNPPSNSIMKSLREEFFNTNYQGNSAKKAYELLDSNIWPM